MHTVIVHRSKEGGTGQDEFNQNLSQAEVERHGHRKNRPSEIVKTVEFGVTKTLL